MALQLIVTNAGRNALVTAGSTSTNSVRIASVGLSETAVVPAATATSLPGQFKTLATVAGAATAPDTIHLMISDQSDDAYSVRSMAFYLADGTLFAIYGQPDPIINKAGSSLMLTAGDVIFADIAATSITFGNADFLNPAATAFTSGVVELADDAEAQTMLDAIRALTPRGLGLVFTAAKILQKLLSVDGAGSGLDADLLDGLDSAAFPKLATVNTYLPSAIQRFVSSGNTGSNAGGNALVAYSFAGSNTGANMSFLREGSFGINMGLDSDNVFRLGGWSAPANLLQITMGGGAYLLGNVVWHAGNDGAGSGSDSDLLDGQHGSYYTDIAGRLGFTPVRQGTGVGQSASIVQIGWGYNGRLKATVDVTDLGNFLFDSDLTAGLVLAKLLTVDGNGSGLDADLLDGRDGSWYSDINARLGYQAFDRAGGTPMNGDIIFDGASNRRLRWTTPNVGFYGNTGDFSLYDFAYNRSVWGYAQAAQTITFNTHIDIDGYLHRGGNQVWDAGNDGNGSGLDADYLDGRDGSWYTDIAARLGYQPFDRAGNTAMNGDILFDGASNRRVRWTTPNVGFYGNAGDFGFYDFAYNRGVWGYAQAPNIIGFYTNIDVAGYLKRGGNQVWDAGNDGSGSGLDADTVDGYHASDLAKYADFPASHNRPGYKLLPGGTLIQWGSAVATDSGGVTRISFPIAFGAVWSAVASNDSGGGVASAWASCGGFDPYGMNVSHTNAPGVGAGAGTAAFWVAIGNI